MLQRNAPTNLLGFVPLRNIAVAPTRFSGDETGEINIGDYLPPGIELEPEVTKTRLLNGTMSYNPIMGLFEPTDEDRGTYEMYNHQIVVSEHVEATVASRGVAAGDLLQLLRGYSVHTEKMAAPNSRGLLGDIGSRLFQSNYTAATPEYVFVHNPYEPGKIQSWDLQWEEGRNEYWSALSCIMESISLSINTRSAINYSASLTGRKLSHRPLRRVATRVPRRLLPSRLVATSAEFYINGHSANSVSSAELMIDSGNAPNWRVGEGIQWTRPVRGRRFFGANITWLRDPRGIAEFRNYLDTIRDEQTLEIIIPVEGQRVNGRPGFIAIQAQVRKNQNSQNPGSDTMEINTAQINYVSIEVLGDDNERGGFVDGSWVGDNPFMLGSDPVDTSTAVSFLNADGTENAPPAGWAIGALVYLGNTVYRATRAISKGNTPPSAGWERVSGNAAASNPSFRVITNIPIGEWDLAGA